MRVHLVTNLFEPDELAGASLYTDLALYLKERGHDIRVTTTFSYYPAWKRRPEDEGIGLREELFHGIPVRRVRMFVPNKPSGATRMLSDASFLGSLWLRGKFPGWKPDVILTALPMFSQCLVQRFWGLRNVPRMIIVQDFVVDAALELGILKFPGIGLFLRKLERYALRSAKTLSSISNEMLKKMQGIVGTDRRTLMIPNWIHGSLQTEIKAQSSRVRSRTPKLMFYSGNVGVKQGLPQFIDSFVKAGSSWRLQVNGGGAEVGRLRESVQGLASVEIGPVLPESEYIAMLNRASACLITQRPGVGANFLPSKLLPILASGTPVLAVCEPDSPLGREVAQAGCGVVVKPGDVETLRKNLLAWEEHPDLATEMGRKAYARSALYSRERILPIYEAELNRLIKEAQSTAAS